MATFTPPGQCLMYAPLEGKDGKALVNTPEAVTTADAAGITHFGEVSHRPSFAHIVCKLDGTDGIVGDYGAMIWQVNGKENRIEINTGCHSGGCYAGWWRGCAREACCHNHYTGSGEVSFGFDLPGDMLPFTCTDLGWIISQGSFICGTPNLRVSAKFAGCSAICGGEGAFLTHVSCKARENIFYAGGFGCIQRQEIPEGMSMLVNNGLFFAAPDSISFHITIVGGCYNCCFGQEGIAMKFNGPTVVYTQNRDPDAFMALLKPIPSKQKKGNNESGQSAVGGG